MITNPSLRKIVEESGRTFITTSMVVEAEKAEREAERGGYKMELARFQAALGMAAVPIRGNYLGMGLGSQLGMGAAPLSLYTGLCPYCGR